MITRILTAVILIAFLFIDIYLFPYPLFLLTITLALFLLLRELSNLLEKYGVLISPPTYFFILVLPWLTGYIPEALPAYLLFCVLLILSTSILLSKTVGTVFPSAAGNVFTYFYLGIPLALGSLFHPLCPASYLGAGQFEELLLVLVAIWLSDSAAYFAGRLIGKHKITPQISPNKTLEGYLAGLTLPPILLPFIGPILLPDESAAFFIASGIIVAATGIAGDLFESLLKRGAEIKDSSNLLPGHGGLLDRLDSFLFAFPAYYLLTLFLDLQSL